MLDVPRSKLEFTPLEFETFGGLHIIGIFIKLEFTPLEFETVSFFSRARQRNTIRIYYVGV